MTDRAAILKKIEEERILLRWTRARDARLRIKARIEELEKARELVIMQAVDELSA